MHTTIDYSNLSKADATKRALADINEWLGNDRHGQNRFANLTEAFRLQNKSKPISPFTFAMYASLSGVRGFPVCVWYNHTFGTDLTHAEFNSQVRSEDEAISSYRRED